MERRGRRNTVVPIDTQTIRKIGDVTEASRPNRLLVEAWALTAARKRGVYVPEVLGYLRDKNDREVLTLERIAGRCLSETRDDAVLARCMFDVGQQLSLLQDIAPRFGWINPETGEGSHDKWADFLVSHVEVYAERLVSAGLLVARLAQRLIQGLRETDLLISTASLVHRDLKFGNLLLDNRMQVAIIDWENAILGDSLYDVAIFGVREGHEAAWRALAHGLNADTSSRRYLLYEAAALVGITDFHHRYESNARDKARQLHSALRNLV